MRYAIARDAAGTIKVADLVSVVLTELGSGIRLSEDTLETRIPIPHGPAAAATVLGLGFALQRYGVGLELAPSELTVVIDKERLKESTRSLEKWAIGLGGVETPYALERLPGARPGGAPVVLIHGLDSRPERMAGAARALVGSGYDVYLYRYPNDGSLEATAHDLAARLSGLHRTHRRKLNVLTTSMGGVIAQAALELEPYTAGTVDRFIACSPPFQGSPMARYHALLEVPETVTDLFTEGFQGFFPFDGLGAAGFDLLPDSSLIKKLQAAARREDVRYTIFAGRKPIVPIVVLDAARSVLFQRLEQASPLARFGYELLIELTDTVASVSNGLGDGAVPLESQTLAGVQDRIVGAFDHLDCFDGDGVSRPIPWLNEALARLASP